MISSYAFHLAITSSKQRFQINDIVVCIDPANDLVLNSVYRIKYITYDEYDCNNDTIGFDVGLYGGQTAFYASRFRHANVNLVRILNKLKWQLVS